MDTDIDNRDIEIDTNITSNIIYLGNLFFFSLTNINM